MTKTYIHHRAENSKRLVTALLFCVACTAVNVVGSRIAVAMHWPLYLDSAGTILASMLGGYVPGILVGYFTHVLISLFDASSFFYSFSSVLVAVAAALFANRGWFKKPLHIVLAILCFAVLGGCVGSVLTWSLYGFTLGDGVASSLIHDLYATGHFTPMAAQLCGDFLVDAMDKAICVALALVVAKLVAKQGVDRIHLQGWQQEPLTDEQVKHFAAMRPRVLSLRAKIVGIMSAIVIVVAVVTTLISYRTFFSSMISEQCQYAVGVTNIAMSNIDPDRVNEYLALGDDAPGYAECEKTLATIRDAFPEVQYIYAYRILKDGCHVVLDPDTADVPGSDPGSVIEFDDAFLPYLDQLLAGEPIDPIISNETYGWLLTVYEPLYNSKGECVCYVATDILMERIMLDGYAFLAQIVSLFGAFFILVCALVLWLAQYGIIFPLNSIAQATSGFAFGDEDDREQTLQNVNALNIRTGDEIEYLYQAISKTTNDTVRFIADSEEKTETISRMQDNLIMVMADLVESRDQFTGDHIRKTTAYVDLIMAEMKENGVYVDQLTDEFMSNVSHSAPLHDIGKILISDTILNKPGRLTAEEFEIMKTHTTAGRIIIERAVPALSEPTYLDEAKRIAEFHHEKWNGTGYPAGLKGTDIPLSARIMAVADVFDALVSKRSYKDGFPLDKAFAIIEEGAGSHFDPLIAKTFLNARDKAAHIASDHGDV